MRYFGIRHARQDPPELLRKRVYLTPLGLTHRQTLPPPYTFLFFLGYGQVREVLGPISCFPQSSVRHQHGSWAEPRSRPALNLPWVEWELFASTLRALSFLQNFGDLLKGNTSGFSLNTPTAGPSSPFLHLQRFILLPLSMSPPL